MKKILIILFFIIPFISKGQWLVPDYIRNYDQTKPTVYAVDLGGGYQQVADSAAKADLSSDKRVVGMMVSYKKNSNWLTQRYDGSDVLTVNWINESNWATVLTSDTLFYYATRQELEDSLSKYTTLDSLNYYMPTTDVRQEISDSINSYNFPSFGTDGQVPYMNAGGTDYLYGGFLYTGTSATDGAFYSGTTNPSFTARLNYNGQFNAHSFISYATASNTGMISTAINGIAVNGTSNTGVSAVFNNGAASSANIMQCQKNFVNKFTVDIDGYINSGNTLEVTADTTFINNHLKVDSNLYAVHTGQFSVVNAVDVTVVDTWLPVKLDSTIQENTTSGLELTNDSTGIIVRFNGVIQISGAAQVLNNSAGSQSAALFFRIKVNDTEKSAWNTHLDKSFSAGDAFPIVSLTANQKVSKNDTLFPEAKFSNANIDLELPVGDFDNEYPFTLNFTQIPSKIQ